MPKKKTPAKTVKRKEKTKKLECHVIGGYLIGGIKKVIERY